MEQKLPPTFPTWLNDNYFMPTTGIQPIELEAYKTKILCYTNIIRDIHVEKGIDKGENAKGDDTFSISPKEVPQDLPMVVAWEAMIWKHEHPSAKVTPPGNILDVLANFPYASTADAQYALGFFYREMGDKPKALHYYTLAANQRYAPAQHALGLLYYTMENKGNKDNKKTAIEHYELAANQGYAPAQNALGYCYYGMKKKKHVAFDYYCAAAEQGYVPAWFNTAYRYEKQYAEDKYENGEYLQKAIRFYQSAVNAGFPCENRLDKAREKQQKQPTLPPFSLAQWLTRFSLPFFLLFASISVGMATIYTDAVSNLVLMDIFVGLEVFAAFVMLTFFVVRGAQALHSYISAVEDTDSAGQASKETWLDQIKASHTTPFVVMGLCALAFFLALILGTDSLTPLFDIAVKALGNFFWLIPPEGMRVIVMIYFCLLPIFILNIVREISLLATDEPLPKPRLDIVDASSVINAQEPSVIYTQEEATYMAKKGTSLVRAKANSDINTQILGLASFTGEIKLEKGRSDSEWKYNMRPNNPNIKCSKGDYIVVDSKTYSYNNVLYKHGALKDSPKNSGYFAPDLVEEVPTEAQPLRFTLQKTT